jgi:fumarate hydratase class II
MSREMASRTGTRVETDTMGPMTVKADRYWGAQTQRSIENFAIGEPSERMPMQVVKALGLIKKAAANVNLRFGILDKKLGAAIIKAAGGE